MQERASEQQTPEFPPTQVPDMAGVFEQSGLFIETPDGDRDTGISTSHLPLSAEPPLHTS